MSNLKLHDYQQDGVNWILSHNGAGLFLPPGLGKTLISLSAIKILKDANEVQRVIVIAPLRVCYMVWRQEVEKWGFDLSVGLLHGKDKDTIVRQKHDIYLINPEGLPWLYNSHLGLLSKYKFMLVCDESTLFKNQASMRFKTLVRMLTFFKRRLILTGTPAPNGLIQLWSQIFILDNGKSLGKNITAYRKRWFSPNFSGFGYAMINGADKEIYSAIDGIVMHKSSDELTLPEKLFNTIDIQLPSAAVKLYKEVKDDFISVFGEDESLITAMNSASQASKLKQIANGNLYGEDKNWLVIHNEKLNACEELVESLGGRPLLIVYEYNHDLEALKATFKGAPHIGGGVSGAVLERTIKNWSAGNIPVLLLQPQAGGHGLNLQNGGCHDVVWYSITFDLELYEQVNARVHRQGVKNSVTIHHIVANGTVDEKVMRALQGKAKLQDALLESLLK
jgi:SNF2 family DNA or RNA helicase